MFSQNENLANIQCYFNGHGLIIEPSKKFQLVCKFQVAKLLSKNYVQKLLFLLYGGESIFMLFERHRLRLCTRSNLIGKPYRLSIFIFYAFLLVLICRGNTSLVLTYLLDRLAAKCKFVHFSVFDFFFFVFTHCLQYCVASFKYGDSEARDRDPTC